jgi:multidrug transporter EmrE-like cation transporter
LQPVQNRPVLTARAAVVDSVIAYYSLAQKEMKSHFKLGLLTVCMAAWSMSAFAGSIETFNYSTNLTGVSSTTVQGTFSFNTATDTFTVAGLSFVGNSIFGGLSGSDTKPQSGTTFVLNENVDGYTVSYTIVLNPLTGTYTANGSITYGGTTGDFQFNQVPEGGTQLSYLAASGLVLFAGMLLAGKQRRQPAEN